MPGGREKLRLPALWQYVAGSGDDISGRKQSQTDYWQKELKEGFSVVVIPSNGRDAERGQFAASV